jgi:hypothetical protein
MADNGTELTTRQRRTIAALLAAKDVREAAKQARVPERTLYTWMTEPAFKTALYEAEGHLIDAATRKLLRYQDAALTTIITIMADKLILPAVRLRAAQTILEQLLKLRELRDIEGRLAALEEAYAKQT